MKKYYLFYALACVVGILSFIGVLIGTIILGILNMYIVSKIIYIISLWVSLIPAAIMVLLLITVADNCAEIEELKREISELKSNPSIQNSSEQYLGPYCTKCGNSILESDAGLCQNCGHIQDESPDGLTVCPSCSKKSISQKDKFCKACGCNLKDKPN